MRDELANRISALTTAQCRRLLRLGKPFGYQPPMVTNYSVTERWMAGEITEQNIIDATQTKPRSPATTKRCTDCTVRDAGKPRIPIIAIYPDGTISVRLEGTKRTEYTTLAAVYAMAVKQRVMAERNDKLRARKARAQ